MQTMAGESGLAIDHSGEESGEAAKGEGAEGEEGGEAEEGRRKSEGGRVGQDQEEVPAVDKDAQPEGDRDEEVGIEVETH
jgi:hypothetical protein